MGLSDIRAGEHHETGQLARETEVKVEPIRYSARVKQLLVEEIANIERRIRDLESVRPSLRRIGGSRDGLGTVDEDPILGIVTDAPLCRH